MLCCIPEPPSLDQNPSVHALSVARALGCASSSLAAHSPCKHAEATMTWMWES